MPVHHFLEESTRRFPDKIALIHDGARHTYAQINDQANSLANYLIATGVSAGDRIAILFENCIEYVVSYYATLKAGAAAVPLNSDIKPEALNRIVADVEPKGIISSSRYERLLVSAGLNGSHTKALILKSPTLAWSDADFAVQELGGVLQSCPTINPNVNIAETDLASVIYTSGSTGRPKGVMLSHENIVSNTLSICQFLRLTSHDIQMVVLPFFYVMGKSLLNTHFAVGGTVLVNNRFAFPAAVLEEMVAENVTGFSGVPSTYTHLLHRSPLASKREKLSALRYCSQAGGHMPRSVKEELRRILPAHTEIFIMYGATEASARLAYLEPERYQEKMDSIGKPISGVTLKILNQHGAEVKPGEAGELVAAGPNVMLGYWKDPESTARALRGGWYHTGDLARRDSEGYFYLLGREDDQLKVGGHRVNPREIENVLMESGMLVETLVVGVQDDLLGQKLVCCCVPKSKDCSESNLLAFCSQRLQKPKVPRGCLFVGSLPKNPSGKIDRERCRELLNRNGSLTFQF